MKMVAAGVRQTLQPYGKDRCLAQALHALNQRNGIGRLAEEGCIDPIALRRHLVRQKTDGLSAHQGPDETLNPFLIGGH